MNNCDFCGAPTRNERESGDELLCQSCRHEVAKAQYRPTALEAALKVASERLPAMLHGRLLQGHDLALSGYVARSGAGGVVKSQTTERVYRITAAGCQCEDAWYSAPTIAGKPACKHQLAIWLLIKADELTPDDFEGVYRESKGWRKFQTPKQSDNCYRWCEKCGDSTKHGFGLGCMTCLERREEAA